MRLNHSIVAAMLVALVITPAFGQSSLKKLEGTLRAPAPATLAPAAGAPVTPPPTGTPGAATPIPGYLGATVDESPEMGKGVVITGVYKGDPSDLGGLKVGDTIVGINGKPCKKLDDLDLVLGQSTVGTKLSFQVQRAGKVETKVVTLGRKKPIEAERSDEPAAPASDPLAAPSIAPATLRPALPPRPGLPAIGADPLASPPSEPAASPPTLRPAITPDDPLVLPVPPGGDKPATDPLADPTAPAPTDPATPDPAGLDPAAPAPTGRASLGIQVVPLNDETRLQYGVRSTARQGAVIVAVKPGSAADTEGLPIGGVIVSIDGQLVKNSDDLVDAISAARPGQEVELRYYHGDRISTKLVTLTPAAARGVVTAPPRPGMILGGADRPLLRKFEDMVESLSPNTPPPVTVGSSIFDPSRLAELHNDIKAMREQLDALDKRVKALEEKGGGNP